MRMAHGSERGAALVLVIGISTMLAILMTGLVAISVNGMRQATSDSNWNAALSAAYAGIDEYQSRLSNDTTYYRFGNPTSTFSTGSDVTLPSGAETNPAFGLGTGGTWAEVSGSSGRARFRYEVDNSTYLTTGRIRLRSTGNVGNATRSIVADLKQQGFIDFLYFTDYEVQDPSVAKPAPIESCYTDSTKTVLKYGWDSRPTSGCNEIQFAAMDTLNGPVHSNDTILSCGAKFTGAVTTANKVSPYYRKPSGCGKSSSFTLAGYPRYSGGVIGMPATNSQLKKETRTDLAETVPRPGCLYTGPTQMTFTGDGKVNIKSPFTKKTRISNDAATEGTAPAECGNIAQLQSSAGATIEIPANNVMYVQNVPAISSDVNYWSASSNPSGFSCVSSGPTSSRGWTLGSGSNESGYPGKQAWIGGSGDESVTSGTTYGCRNGDVFVKGAFDGAATIAAENYIFVVGDITYVDDQTDILGLVGNNAVWVWNPLYTKNRNYHQWVWNPFYTENGNYHQVYRAQQPRRIDAAILSVAHTFMVQNYDKGTSRGTLTVNGAIAQKYRGPVAVPGRTGYAKDYKYDERFKFKAPPKFLNPVTTTYGVTTWVETAAAFKADGAAR